MTKERSYTRLARSSRVMYRRGKGSQILVFVKVVVRVASEKNNEQFPASYCWRLSVD